MLEGDQRMRMLFAEIYDFYRLYRWCVMAMEEVLDSMEIKWTCSEEGLWIFKDKIGHVSWCLVSLVRSCQRQKDNLDKS